MTHEQKRHGKETEFVADINEVLHIARQAEANFMKDTYSKGLPINMISFCRAVKELLKEQQAEIERLKAKETPMKPNDINKYIYDTWKGSCGFCGGIVFNLHVCCPHCGQKQDWSYVNKDGEQK